MTTKTGRLMHFEPEVEDRVYYRHITTGDLGYLVRREGRDCMRYDQQGQDRYVPFIENNWIMVDEDRTFPPMTLVQVAYEADRKLCHMYGKILEARTEWLSLRDDDRIDFLNNGPPPNPPIRVEVYKAIMKVMSKAGIK